MQTTMSTSQDFSFAAEENFFNTAVAALSTISHNPILPTNVARRKVKGHSSISQKVLIQNTEVEFGFAEKQQFLECECHFCTKKILPAPESATWKEVLHCVFRVMSVYYKKQYFSMKNEIFPFIEFHWKMIWESKVAKKWDATVCMIVSKYTHIFKSGSSEMKTTGYWGLASFDLEKFTRELNAIAYSRPQNQKRPREVPYTELKVILPPPKKRTVDDGSMLSVLASMAMECGKENLTKQLQSEIGELKQSIETKIECCLPDFKNVVGNSTQQPQVYQMQSYVISLPLQI